MPTYRIPATCAFHNILLSCVCEAQAVLVQIRHAVLYREAAAAVGKYLYGAAAGALRPSIIICAYNNGCTRKRTRKRLVHQVGKRRVCAYTPARHNIIIVTGVSPPTYYPQLYST